MNHSWDLRPEMNDLIKDIYRTSRVHDEIGNEYELQAQISPAESVFLAALIDKDHTVKTTLEVGCAYGMASMAICAQSALDGAASVHIFARRTSRYWNRTQKFAENLSAKTGCQVCLFDNDDHTALRDSIAQSYLLINATSVGMVPDIDDTIIKDTSLFHPELVVADVVYEPQETRLLREAKAAGCQTFNGMYMLLHQGAKAFQIWTGQEMPVSVIKEKYFSVK